MNNWVEVEEGRLAGNYRALQRAVGEATEVLAVVKANAYGHGAEVCAPILVRAGARWLGVTSAHEGAKVRRVVGPGVEILVMCGSLPEDAGLLVEHELTPVVWTREQMEGLPAGMRVHVEVDTGMGRQGVAVGAGLADVLQAAAERGLVVDGVFTHFCSSEVAGSALTQRQERLFEDAVRQVGEAGLRPAWVHAGNSSTVDNPAQAWPWLVELAASVGARAVVRPGLALYGYCLAIAGEGQAMVCPALLPAMTWKASVLAVRELAAGETVGYNATFTAEGPMRVALLAVGYADGLRRELSGGAGWVMLHGERARVLGRVSMNLTVVDVTGLTGVGGGVRAGDAAVVLGEGVTADDHARAAGTIAYEILCGVHPCG